MKEKIKFKNLSFWLKTAIITSWLILGSFTWGLLVGLLEEMPKSLH